MLIDFLLGCDWWLLPLLVLPALAWAHHRDELRKRMAENERDRYCDHGIFKHKGISRCMQCRESLQKWFDQAEEKPTPFQESLKSPLANLPQLPGHEECTADYCAMHPKGEVPRQAALVLDQLIETAYQLWACAGAAQTLSFYESILPPAQAVRKYTLRFDPAIGRAITRVKAFADGMVLLDRGIPTVNGPLSMLEFPVETWVKGYVRFEVELNSETPAGPITIGWAPRR